MEYISETGIIVEDPFLLRPGSDVKVKVTLNKVFSTTWDSSTTFTKKFYNGYVVLSSVQPATDVSINLIDITYQENATTVTISPANAGTMDLDIYYSTTEKRTVSSQSALSAAQNYTYNSANYEYVIEQDGNVYPMAYIDISSYYTLSEISSVELIYQSEDTGICYTGDQYLRVNSEGLLNTNEYILSTGKEYVWTSGEYTGDYKQESSDRKYIEIHNLECIVPNMEFYGLEYINDIFFVLTSQGLYGFDKRSDYVDWKNRGLANAFRWGNLRVTDITYVDDDTLAVVNDLTINKYHIRHDFVLMDKDNDRVYARERFPDMELI